MSQRQTLYERNKLINTTNEYYRVDHVPQNEVTSFFAIPPNNIIFDSIQRQPEQ